MNFQASIPELSDASPGAQTTELAKQVWEPRLPAAAVAAYLMAVRAHDISQQLALKELHDHGYDTTRATAVLTAPKAPASKAEAAVVQTVTTAESPDIQQHICQHKQQLSPMAGNPQPKSGYDVPQSSVGAKKWVARYVCVTYVQMG